MELRSKSKENNHSRNKRLHQKKERTTDQKKTTLKQIANKNCIYHLWNLHGEEKHPTNALLSTKL